MQPKSKEHQITIAVATPQLGEPPLDARLPYVQPRVETSQQPLQAMLASGCETPAPSGG